MFPVLFPKEENKPVGLLKTQLAYYSDEHNLIHMAAIFTTHIPYGLVVQINVFHPGGVNTFMSQLFELE